MGAAAIIGGSAIVGAGMGLAGSAMSAGAASDAASTQAAASDRAVAEQQAAREQARQYMEPYYQQGLDYQKQMAQLMPLWMTPYNMDMYKQSPEYQNQLLATKKAQEGILAQAAASGRYGGGAIDLALQQAAQEQAQLGYQQGLADYWTQGINAYNMLSPYVASGQNAAALQGGTATNMANAIAGTMQAGGAQQAAYQQAAGNAWGQGLAGVGNQIMGGIGAYNQSQMFDKYLNSMSNTGVYQ